MPWKCIRQSSFIWWRRLLIFLPRIWVTRNVIQSRSGVWKWLNLVWAILCWLLLTSSMNMEVIWMEMTVGWLLVAMSQLGLQIFVPSMIIVNITFISLQVYRYRNNTNCWELEYIERLPRPLIFRPPLANFRQRTFRTSFEWLRVLKRMPVRCNVAMHYLGLTTTHSPQFL